MDRRFEGWSSPRAAPGCALLLAAIATLSACGGQTGRDSSSSRSPLSFAAPRNYAAGSGAGSVAIGDLNGDRRPDLVTTNSGGDSVSVLLNRGGSSFQTKRDYPTGYIPGSIAIGDLNGDGKPDLVTTNAGGIGVSVLLNRGSGSFQARRDYATDEPSNGVAIGDLNGDGKPDLATANGGDERRHSHTISVLANSGDGSFETKRRYVTGQIPGSVAIGDLNGDGKLDVTTANSDYLDDKLVNAVSVLFNSGDGSFHAKRDYPTGGSGAGPPTSVAIGDLNGDGKPDLVTAIHGGVSVLLNKGDGSFPARRDYPTGGFYTSVAIGDLNGDGRPELATANADANTLSVLVNSGDGSFQPKLDYATGRHPLSVAIGDLNGDGKPDLASANCELSPDLYCTEEEHIVSVLLHTTG